MFDRVLNRPLDSQLAIRKLLYTFLAALKFLGLHFTDTQLVGRILESLPYKNSVILLLLQLL